MPEQTDTPAPKLKAPAADVLVENRRHGITVGTVSERDPNATNATQQWRTDNLQILPGLQFVEAERWEKHREGLEPRIASSEIVAPFDFAKASIPTITEALRNSGHIPTLRRLLEVEKRPQVVKLIESAIRDTESGAATARSHVAAYTPR